MGRCQSTLRLGPALIILTMGKAGVVFVGIELIKDKPGVMCIDTVFICFCEDCEINNGQDQPYFMSRGLMEFVEKSQKALRARAGRARQQQQQAKHPIVSPILPRFPM
ncbi:hypothetical protein DAPPUDRAFT_269039 [Daphnia pulex]|uniref:Uncharacterized protein n=1 Tax=Daphnia pulex TaxID=6669 RepID=E9HYQ8_DAPPU|nr:hypothetical protein DAPPUDRAFT_269039 [Daphnia pulex]|eukprot:EFX63122.1 hypothetical protein DAPPUDRAFT_269039 [Daphnia pulex]